MASNETLSARNNNSADEFYTQCRLVRRLLAAVA
jgi:hypothetical protein